MCPALPYDAGKLEIRSLSSSHGPMTKLDHNRPILKAIDSANRARSSDIRETIQIDSKNHEIIPESILIIHRRLYDIACRWKATNDSQTAARSTTRLPFEYPPLSARDLEPWVNKYFGFYYDIMEDVFKRGNIKGKELNLKRIMNNRWWEIDRALSKKMPVAFRDHERTLNRIRFQDLIINCFNHYISHGDIRPLLINLKKLSQSNTTDNRDFDNLVDWSRRNIGLYYDSLSKEFRYVKLPSRDIDLNELSWTRWWCD